MRTFDCMEDDLEVVFISIGDDDRRFNETVDYLRRSACLKLTSVELFIRESENGLVAPPVFGQFDQPDGMTSKLSHYEEQVGHIRGSRHRFLIVEVGYHESVQKART